MLSGLPLLFQKIISLLSNYHSSNVSVLKFNNWPDWRVNDSKGANTPKQTRPAWLLGTLIRTLNDGDTIAEVTITAI
jgi:hypothetical protein